MDNFVGATLGQYKIIEKIGQGGMAHVYKAYQPGLDRFVAIKVLAPSLVEEPGFAERFQREAQAVARLHHPNILQVHDYGTQDNYSYIVMRYVENSRTLSDLIHAAAPTEMLIDYIVQVADALHYAHEQGVVHRDVKPSNILIDGKWALLGDFGLVKLGGSSSDHLTRTGVGMGTPAYMSPEQVTGIGVDRRSDIYALGIILYQILTGTVPHEASTPIAIMIKRKTEPVMPLHQIKPDVSTSLEHVVLRSLAAKPDDRYSTATEFVEAIRKAEKDPNYREQTIPSIYELEDDKTIAHSNLTLPSSPLQTQIAPISRSHRSLLIGGAIAGVVIVIGALIVFLVTTMTSSQSSAGQLSNPTNTPKPTSTLAIAAATSTPTPPTATPAAPRGTPSSSDILPHTPSLVALTDLEVRHGPGDEYDLLGYLPGGATAEVSGRDKSGQWWQIKTSLGTAGVGWLKAAPTQAKISETQNVPIALAPPLPTSTLTLSATPVANTPTGTPVPATPPPTTTPTQPGTTAASLSQPTLPIPTRTPAAPEGQFTLLKPLSPDQPSYGPAEFEWQWTVPLEQNQGFEVRVWREGEPPAGVHNAVEDNLNGKIQALGNNTYRLNVNIYEAFGVKGRSGEYWWTVILVQVSPEYKDLGFQAPPDRLRFEAGGGSDGGGKGDGGSGGGSSGSGSDF